MTRASKEDVAAERANYLEHARALGEFTYYDLMRFGRSRKWVGLTVGEWLSRGYVTPAGKRGPRTLFRATLPAFLPGAANQGAMPARGSSKEGNMWRSMRLLKVFSPADLAMYATTAAVLVTEGEAVHYCETLCAAQYLRSEVKPAPGQRPARYRIIRDTGPMPPRKREMSVVWDGNRDEMVHVLRASS